MNCEDCPVPAEQCENQSICPVDEPEITSEDLAKEMNERHYSPATMRGKVTLVQNFYKDDTWDHEEVVTNYSGEGYLEDHPEGADRGGYVPYWERGDATAYYSSNEEWVAI